MSFLDLESFGVNFAAHFDFPAAAINASSEQEIVEYARRQCRRTGSFSQPWPGISIRERAKNRILRVCSGQSAKNSSPAL